MYRVLHEWPVRSQRGPPFVVVEDPTQTLMTDNVGFMSVTSCDFSISRTNVARHVPDPIKMFGRFLRTRDRDSIAGSSSSARILFDDASR